LFLVLAEEKAFQLMEMSRRDKKTTTPQGKLFVQLLQLCKSKIDRFPHIYTFYAPHFMFIFMPELTSV